MSELATLFSSTASALGVAPALQREFLARVLPKARLSPIALSVAVATFVVTGALAGHFLGSGRTLTFLIVLVVGLAAAIAAIAVAYTRARADQRARLPKNVSAAFLRAKLSAVDREDFEAVLVAATKAGLLIPRLIVRDPSSGDQVGPAYTDLQAVPEAIEESRGHRRITVTPEMLEVLFDVRASDDE